MTTGDTVEPGMKYILTNRTDFTGLKELPVKGKIINLGSLQVLCAGEAGVMINDRLLLNDGYLRDLEKEFMDDQGQQEGILDQICRTWPLPDHITGSFSATVVDISTGTISLCTDQVGLYPLYYWKSGDTFLISNSITWMGMVSGSEFDEAGIAQRCLGPELENIGSRTILKNCKRLLPGECLRFDFNGYLLSQQYDNRLYSEMTSPDQEHDLWKEYWEDFKEEVKYAVNYSEKVNVALSGGIDSRVVLGSIPEEKQVNCYTYGHPKNYESKIASRLAKLKGAHFTACFDPDLYFPAPEKLENYALTTEALQLCSWLEVTEQIQTHKNEPLLLGELCEGLPGRKIGKFSTRKFRQENFFKYYIQNRDYTFKATTEQDFVEWKEKIVRKFRMYYNDRKLGKLNLQTPQEDLIAALESDLEEVFSRIEAHQLPYVELFDELFSWYTYTRMRLSKQLLLAGSKFNAYSPAMSLRVLTRTSNLHPNIRLNYRFAKKLFSNHEELRKLNHVPTSQAPLIPQNFPDLFKFAMWGFRSKVDEALTKRMMKKKRVSARYRLFKSINWAQVYQHPAMEKHLGEYFSSNQLGEQYVQEILQQARMRKSLDQWPFANINIINAASLNMELNFIKNFQRE